MTLVGSLLHLGLGWLEGALSLLLMGWIARLAERAHVPEPWRAMRWLPHASALLSGLLLAWGSAGDRPWAVELAGALIAVAVWTRWRRRARPGAGESCASAGR